jgi:hypothetical protein
MASETELAGQLGDPTVDQPAAALELRPDLEPEPGQEATARSSRNLGPATIVLVVIVAVIAERVFASALAEDTIQTWATVFLAICLQALPFLVLGVCVGGRDRHVDPAVLL